jgi:hypothetical protein
MMRILKRGKKTSSDVSSETAAKVRDVAKPRCSIQVHYPQEGDTVYRGHYAIRVDAQNMKDVLVSINGGNWQNCREASGHHWCDWFPSQPGSCRIAAKATGSDGREVKSAVCTCKVI